jgi:RNA polymerase sigma-54 factor
MKPGLNQSTQLRQELKINPRLYQAMDLLYMPLLDLQQHLKQELLNNPFLEMVEPEDEEEEEGEGAEAEEAPQQEEQKANNDEIDWEGILLDGFDAGGRREEHEEKEYYEPVTVATRDLGDHLRDQIALLDLDPRQMLLADEFVGNINEDGYLACPHQRRGPRSRRGRGPRSG